MIPFNRAKTSPLALEYVQNVFASGKLAGDGEYTKKCTNWLTEQVGSPQAFLTPSCTAALEMAALLLDIQAGDEVIMPSYTFTSTATAFVLRGAVPVFVDVRADTLNIDENKLEEAITDKTKAIVVVHYAGVSCEMEAVCSIAKRHQLFVIEDAAQALMANYQDTPLGSFGDIACFSFHETKNIVCGEGGAILINRDELVDRAHVIREKGTNRKQFFQGKVDKYTWVDTGSSYLLSEINAAVLWSQLQDAERITKQRLESWQTYEQFAKGKGLSFGSIPKHCQHNAHIFYLLLPQRVDREVFFEQLRQLGVSAVSHYVPLHLSKAGLLYGKTRQALSVTEAIHSQIARLPLWQGVEEHQVELLEKMNIVLENLL